MAHTWQTYLKTCMHGSVLLWYVHDLIFTDTLTLVSKRVCPYNHRMDILYMYNMCISILYGIHMNPRIDVTLTVGAAYVSHLRIDLGLTIIHIPGELHVPPTLYHSDECPQWCRSRVTTFPGTWSQSPAALKMLSQANSINSTLEMSPHGKGSATTYEHDPYLLCFEHVQWYPYP